MIFFFIVSLAFRHRKSKIMNFLLHLRFQSQMGVKPCVFTSVAPFSISFLYWKKNKTHFWSSPLIFNGRLSQCCWFRPFAYQKICAHEFMSAILIIDMCVCVRAVCFWSGKKKLYRKWCNGSKHGIFEGVLINGMFLMCTYMMIYFFMSPASYSCKWLVAIKPHTHDIYYKTLILFLLYP